MNQYKKQALDFLKETGTEFKITFSRIDRSFFGDGAEHDVYNFIFTRNGKQYASEFGDSIQNTLDNLQRRNCGIKRRRPSAYDVLSCLTKDEPPSDPWDFAEEFGYEIHNKKDFRRVEDIWLAVTKEYMNVCLLWGDVMDKLMEIE